MKNLFLLILAIVFLTGCCVTWKDVWDQYPPKRVYPMNNHGAVMDTGKSSPSPGVETPSQGKFCDSDPPGGNGEYGGWGDHPQDTENAENQGGPTGKGSDHDGPVK